MLVLLVLSALVSGSEVAFFSLSPSAREELRDATDSGSQRVIRLLELPEHERASKWLLATILIANNFINIAIVLVSTFVMDTLSLDLSQGLEILMNVVGVTFLIVLFGEVIPKVYATSYNKRLARFMSLPLLFIGRAFQPLSWVLIRSTNFVDKRFGQRGSNISVDELEHALELTQDEDRTSEEHKILEGIVNFGSKDVKQIMTSRMDIKAFTTDQTTHDIIEGILDYGYSRIPVYTKSLDEIEGILYIKDLLPHLQKEDVDWQALLRAPFFIPENKKIDDLLREFQEKKIHLAVVVDEYGGTSGLVTLEDVIEEIVGDITDEFDDDSLQYSKLDDNNYVFEGKTPLIDIYRILDIDGEPYEEAKGEADSIAGFMIEQAGKIPLKGERITFESLTFTVEAADKRRVKRIKITIQEVEEKENDME